MKVINIHKRIIDQPVERIAALFKTLSTANDKMLETDKWPPMILNNGINAGSRGGHGPIRYRVDSYQPEKYIQFRFEKPKGFHGIHRFEIISTNNNRSTEIRHIIEMNTSGGGSLIWLAAIRWLHDAFIEDAFDKVENHFLTEKKKTNWSFWVRFLRKILKPKQR
ncbi:hypothetical protein BH09BAC3_BH09BAC3_24310 [soil metagenome]